MNFHSIKSSVRLLPILVLLLFLGTLLLQRSLQGQSTLYQVGDIVENFTLINRATNEEMSLYDMEGQVIFLEWFAHWCPFCRAAAFEIGPGIVEHYKSSNGNPQGVPVLHVGLNLEDSSPSSTQNFINTYGLGLVLNDFDRMVASRFQSRNQPIFAIINGVANSPSHQQWELLYTRLGYRDLDHPITEFRSVIDGVQAAAEVPGFEDYLEELGVPENQRAEVDDPDFDGVPNVLEYFQGSGALDTQSFARPRNRIILVGNMRYQALEYVRDPAAGDVLVEAQFSNNPGFGLLNGRQSVSAEPMVGGLERVVVRSALPLDGDPEFSRLYFQSSETQ